MKKLLLAALLLAPVIARAQMATSQRVGEVSVSDGALPQLRADLTGAQVATDAHGHFSEAARRNHVFILDSDAVTLAAANATKSALGTVKLINGIYNPTTSKYNAEVLWASAVTSTASASGGPFYLNYICGVTVTSANTGTIRPALLSNNPGASAMAPEVGVTITVSGGATTALTQLLTLGGPQNSVGAQNGNQLPITGSAATVQLDGLVVVPPGCLFGITANGAGSGHIVQSSIAWEEVKVQP